MDIINILMRFVHILSAVTLIGGAIAWRFGTIPGIAVLGEEVRGKTDRAVAAALRPFVWASALGLLLSGIYNFLHKTGMQPAWHAVFGVKFLLALHVFAVAMLVTRAENAKRQRLLTGLVFSGVTIVALSAVLRFLSSN